MSTSEVIQQGFNYLPFYVKLFSALITRLFGTANEMVANLTPVQYGYCGTDTMSKSSCKDRPVMSVTNFVETTDVLKAEIMWTLRTVTTHCSYKSNDYH